MKKFCSILVLLLIFSESISYSQKPNAAANKIKAVFIFNFTRFIDWPASSFNSPEDPFVIGVIGNNPFEDYLAETVADEKVGGHPIVVHYFTDQKEITNCQLLYINYSDDLRIRETIEAVGNKSILTVGETSSFEKMGGMIRFYTEQNKIRMQINSDAAKTAQLVISSKLLNLSKAK